MTRYWLGRLAEVVPLLVGASLLAVLLFTLAPGDPAALVVDPALLSADERAAVRAELGLDAPFPVRWARLLGGIATGDLRSFKSKQPTWQIVAAALPTTAIVAACGLGLATALALPWGILAARRPGCPADRLLSAGLALGLAVPPFLLGLLLVRLVAEEWRLLPGSGIAPPGAGGFDPRVSLPHLVLPAVVVAWGPTPILARYLRDGLAQALGADYVRTARAKGLGEWAVVLRHALRNALIGVVGLLSTIVPVALGGSVIIERVFGLPGLGKVTVDAALGRDYPVVLTTTLFVATLVVGTNLAVDLLYGVLDPRIRLARRHGEV
jgi:peptide/nickel transport system permease protein